MRIASIDRCRKRPSQHPATHRDSAENDDDPPARHPCHRARRRGQPPRSRPPARPSVIARTRRPAKAISTPENYRRAHGRERAEMIRAARTPKLRASRAQPATPACGPRSSARWTRATASSAESCACPPTRGPTGRPASREQGDHRDRAYGRSTAAGLRDSKPSCSQRSATFGVREVARRTEHSLGARTRRAERKGLVHN